MDTAQLGNQRSTRTIIKRAAVLARVFIKTANGAVNQSVVISHCALSCLQAPVRKLASAPRSSCLAPLHVFFQQS
jgi:hypothetical protein